MPGNPHARFSLAEAARLSAAASYVEKLDRSRGPGSPPIAGGRDHSSPPTWPVTITGPLDGDYYPARLRPLAEVDPPTWGDLGDDGTALVLPTASQTFEEGDETIGVIVGEKDGVAILECASIVRDPGGGSGDGSGGGNACCEGEEPGDYGACPETPELCVTWWTEHQHLESVAVRVGQRIRPGQKIGDTGRYYTGAHAHFGLGGGPFGISTSPVLTIGQTVDIAEWLGYPTTGTRYPGTFPLMPTPFSAAELAYIQSVFAPPLLGDEWKIGYGSQAHNHGEYYALDIVPTGVDIGGEPSQEMAGVPQYNAIADGADVESVVEFVGELNERVHTMVVIRHRRRCCPADPQPDGGGGGSGGGSGGGNSDPPPDSGGNPGPNNTIDVLTGLCPIYADDDCCEGESQPLSPVLTEIASLTPTANTVLGYDGSAVAGYFTVSPFARTFLNDADAATVRATIGAGTVTSVAVAGSNGVTVVSGSPITGSGTIAISLGNITPTSVVASGAVSGSNLSGTNTGDQTITISGDGSGSGTGAITFTLATVPVAKGGTGATDATTARANLGLAIGTNVQAYDAELAALAGLTSAADKLAYFTGSGTAALADLTSFIRTLLDDTDAATARTTLGVANVPTGTVLDFAGTSAPSGYLACDGSAVSRTTYADLFAAIGTTWGVGNGSTTFNVPNFQRRVAVGSGGTGTGTLGNAVGNTGGAETHTLALTETVPHTHDARNRSGVSGGGITGWTGTTNDTSTGLQTGSAGGSGGVAQPHNNLQPSAVVLKIIKT